MDHVDDAIDVTVEAGGSIKKNEGYYWGKFLDRAANRFVEGVSNYNICVYFDKISVRYYKMCVIL